MTCTKDSLPTLDVAALGALELFSETPVPVFDAAQFVRPVVVGSGNAAVTGRALFVHTDAVFANETTFKERIAFGVEAVVIISASGGKHAVHIAKEAHEREIPTWLLTANPHAAAAAHVDPSRLYVYPKNREPYTYNTSSYMGMLLSATNESPSDIHTHIEHVVAPRIPQTLSAYDAFFFIVPPQFDAIRSLFITKFEELFGAHVSGRVFTIEEAKHAETVVPSERELFISFGTENTVFGAPAARLHIPLPASPNFVAMMAVGYYVIGQIQRQHSPYFAEHIGAYVEEASRLFGEQITVIVE